MKQHKHQFSKEFLGQFKDAKELSGHFGQMFKDAVEQMLEGEMDAHLGFDKHERTEGQKENYRNGHTSKTIKTDMGEVPLEVPRDRNGSFEPQAVAKRQTVMDDVSDAVISLYGAGMTVRDIEAQVQRIYGVTLSDSTVSRITDRLLALVHEWQNRALQPTYLVVWLDAIYFKVRQGHRVVSKAMYVAIGLDTEGRREVLGFWVAQSESAAFWMQVLDNLRQRGVADILLLATDNLAGFTKAVQATFPHTLHQLCVTHQIRNSLRYIADRDKREFCKDLKSVYAVPTREEGERGLAELERKWGGKYAAVVQSWRNNWEHLAVFFDYPTEIRRIFYTTNIIENFNRMLRKYTKNRLIFPSDEAVTKAAFLAVQHTAEVWAGTVANAKVILLQFDALFPERLGVKI
jgi:putative transposase